MRMIGYLETESGARTFSDYLYAEGIGNEIEQERNGAWALWIQDEDQIGAATELLERYRAHPADPKYKEAQRVAREKKEREELENEVARKRFFDSRRIFPTGIAGIGALTAVLVAICAAVGVFSSLGTNTAFIQPLSIAEYFIDGVRGAKRILARGSARRNLAARHADFHSFRRNAPFLQHALAPRPRHHGRETAGGMAACTDGTRHRHSVQCG
jgi:hypothetical protein